MSDVRERMAALEGSGVPGISARASGVPGRASGVPGKPKRMKRSSGVPGIAAEGLSDVLMRRVLRRTMAPKKVRKKGEEIGARAAASEPGQALLKKGGVLTLPTRVASKMKVRMMDLMQKIKGKPKGQS